MDIGPVHLDGFQTWVVSTCGPLLILGALIWGLMALAERLQGKGYDKSAFVVWTLLGALFALPVLYLLGNPAGVSFGQWSAAASTVSAHRTSILTGTAAVFIVLGVLVGKASEGEGALGAFGAILFISGLILLYFFHSFSDLATLSTPQNGPYSDTYGTIAQEFSRHGSQLVISNDTADTGIFPTHWQSGFG